MSELKWHKPPGWYTTPDGNHHRWWNGMEWVGVVSPGPAPMSPSAPPAQGASVAATATATASRVAGAPAGRAERPPSGKGAVVGWIVIVVIVLSLLGSCLGGDDSPVPTGRQDGCTDSFTYRDPYTGKKVTESVCYDPSDGGTFYNGEGE